MEATGKNIMSEGESEKSYGGSQSTTEGAVDEEGGEKVSEGRGDKHRCTEIQTSAYGKQQGRSSSRDDRH